MATQVRGGQIKDETINSVDLASGSVKAGEMSPQAITGQTAITTVDTTNDMLLIFDATDSALKKVAPTDLGLTSPAGSDKQVQYNNGGAFGGAAGLVYDDINRRLGIGHILSDNPQYLLHLSGGADSTVLTLEGNGDVGIRLAGDKDNTGEGDNPYIYFYQDGLSPSSPNNRLFAIALEGDAGATFDGSLVNTPYLDSSYGGGTSARSFQIATGNGTDHSARFTIAADGNTGIGTSTPEVQLHVTSSHDATAAILVEGNGVTIKSGSHSSYGSSLKFMNTGYSHATMGVSGSAFVIAETSADSGQWTGAEPLLTIGMGADATGGGSGPTQGYIGVGTANPAALLHISSSIPGVLFRIDHPDSGIDNPIFFVTGSAGQSKVGIGTDTPDATFAISDDGKVFEVGSAAEGSWFEVNNGTVYFNQGGGLAISGGTSLGQRFNISPINASAGALGIGKYPGSTVNLVEVNSDNAVLRGDYFVIDSDGQTGIGTTSPDAILHIDNGTSNTEFVIEKDAGTSGSIVFHNAGSREAEIAFSTSENIEVTNHVADKDITLNIVSGSTAAAALTVDASTGAVIANKQFARGVASLDLGSGTTSTLDPSVIGAGTILVTASSITVPTSGALEGLHLCDIPDGKTAGQILTVCIITDLLTGTGGPATIGAVIFSPTTPIPSSVTVAVPGSAAGGTPQGASFTLLWTGSGWMRLSAIGGAA